MLWVCTHVYVCCGCACVHMCTCECTCVHFWMCARVLNVRVQCCECACVHICEYAHIPVLSARTRTHMQNQPPEPAALTCMSPGRVSCTDLLGTLQLGPPSYNAALHDPMRATPQLLRALARSGALATFFTTCGVRTSVVPSPNTPESPGRGRLGNLTAHVQVGSRYKHGSYTCNTCL